jgi:hypothetical protein
MVTFPESKQMSPFFHDGEELHIFAVMMMKYLTRKTETNDSNICWYQMRVKVGTSECEIVARSHNGSCYGKHYLVTYFMLLEHSFININTIACYWTCFVHAFDFLYYIHTYILKEHSASIFELKLEAAGFYIL